jgi:hypothetical protein
MKIHLLFFLLILTASLCAWGDFEGLYSFDDPANLGFITSLEGSGLYYYLQDAQIHEANLQPWHSGWNQGAIPQPGYIGFRAVEDSLLNPLYSLAAPELYAYTPLEVDPLGDHLYPNASLDIITSKIAFTDERLYFALQVAGDGFPVSSGFTYYAYMPVIVDPSAEIESDPIVYGLMYTVEIGSLIGPALYKITGSGFDGLTRLGDIQHSVVGNTLILSCALADLMADADFASWFDPDYPLFATSFTTSQITLTNGIQQADITQGIKVLVKPQYLEYQNQSSPELSNGQIVAEGEQFRILIDYFDADANVPQLARVFIDDNEGHYPLIPQNPQDLDYRETVSYASSLVALPAQWQQVRIEFSDAENYVEYSITNPVHNADHTQSPAAGISIYPNPVRNRIRLKSTLPIQSKVGLYNLRGQLLRHIGLSREEAELDLSELPPGVYLLRGKGIKPARFVKL